MKNDTHDDPRFSDLSDEELYDEALRAARARKVSLVARLYVAMADRGLPYAKQREIVNTMWPPTPWSRRSLRRGRR